jgi:hypothetical protein
MVYSIKIPAALGLCTLVLAGCESGTPIVDDTAARNEYNAVAEAYNDMRTDLQALPLSGADMPTVGSATYEGYATLLVDTPIDSALVGDARIVADFTDGELWGNLSNFVGTVDGSTYDDFAGTIALSDGQIGVTTASSLTADMQGTLSSGTDTLTIDGGVQGNFRSDGAINAVGLTASDTAGTDYIVNGFLYDGDTGIVAER